MNPVEAKVVKSPKDYRWSSYMAYIAETVNPHITTTKILSHIPEPQKEKYRKFAEGPINVNPFN